MEIELMDVPDLTALPGDTVCELDTVLLQAIGTVDYYWYPDDGLIGSDSGNVNAIIHQSGWVYVSGLPDQLCPPSDSVYYHVWPLPQVQAWSMDTSFCEGDSVKLFSSGADTYHWFPESLVEHPDSANTNTLFGSSGYFIVTGIDSNQCSHSDTVWVELKPMAVMGLAAISQICIGDSASIIASGGVTYAWSPSNLVFPDTGSIVHISPDINTTYELEITDSNGCTWDTSFTVTVSSLPTANFNIDTVKVDCEGSWLQFINLSSGANQYHWNFGNGNTSVETDPQSLYPFGYTYLVWLTVTNSAGCSVTYTDTIETVPLAQLLSIKEVNVFTPDFNGMNDELDFNIPAEFIECAKVYVFDRWGVQMFESESGNLNWTGNMQGKPVPEGTYFWVLEVNGIIFNGFVQIFK